MYFRKEGSKNMEVMRFWHVVRTYIVIEDNWVYRSTEAFRCDAVKHT
jgi:hypothetical protein